MKRTFFILLSLISFTTYAQLPSLNKKVIEYVNTVIGKKVDKGECWDLANNALRFAKAKWNGEYIFGKEVNPKKDTIYPGDLIQLENVFVEYTKDGMQWKEQFPHHTAIVYEVTATGEYKIANQNTSQTGRKVGITEFRIKDVKKGKLTFYRPTNK